MVAAALIIVVVVVVAVVVVGAVMQPRQSLNQVGAGILRQHFGLLHTVLL